eukprot:4556290-Pleurochrysis_carterae.AAC.3
MGKEGRESRQGRVRAGEREGWQAVQVCGRGGGVEVAREGSWTVIRQRPWRKRAHRLVCDGRLLGDGLELVPAPLEVAGGAHRLLEHPVDARAR